MNEPRLVEDRQHLYGDGGAPESHGPCRCRAINMSGIDGHEVLKRIKNDHCTRHIPVVMLTTAANACEVDRSYEGGCNVYINKPMDSENFTSAVKQLGLFIQTACISRVQRVLAGS